MNDLLLSSMCVLYELEGNLPSSLGFTPTYSGLITVVRRTNQEYL